MSLPPTSDSGDDVARRLIRNTVLGFVAMMAITFGICIANTSATMALALAVLPAAFAAPFVGGLVTMVHYSKDRSVRVVAPKPVVTAVPAELTVLGGS